MAGRHGLHYGVHRHVDGPRTGPTAWTAASDETAEGARKADRREAEVRSLATVSKLHVLHSHGIL